MPYSHVTTICHIEICLQTSTMRTDLKIMQSRNSGRAIEKLPGPEIHSLASRQFSKMAAFAFALGKYHYVISY